MNDENLVKGEPYRFKPGQSGNPGGRPKKRPFSDVDEENAQLEVPEEVRIKYGLPPGSTYAHAVSMAKFRAAIGGDMTAARELREAVEGKSGQRFEPNLAEIQEIRVTYDPLPMSIEVQKLAEKRAEQRAEAENLIEEQES
jgi:Family of unknown function (DUF5681)